MRVELYLLFVAILNAVQANIPKTDYDVLIVGGGPSGLSAASAMARVVRKTVLIDSREYRNSPTRCMHDVIGSDGVVPSEFRYKARLGIEKYNTTTFVNATVTSLTANNTGNFTTFTAHVDSSNKTYTARKVILGTGIKDILPNTTGVPEAFGKGIYWCPWCDGYEHRNQSMGILGPLSEIYGSIQELYPTLNRNLTAYANGTDTPEQRDMLNKTQPNWQKILDTHGIVVKNHTISNITRLKNGTSDCAAHRLDDKFRIYLEGNESDVIGAFITNFPIQQRSKLPSQLSLQMNGPKVNTSCPQGVTNVTGVWAVGDITSDNSTNVAHAMGTGKAAAVDCHRQLSQEDLIANIQPLGGRSGPYYRSVEIKKQMGNEIEELYRKLRRI